MTNTSADIVQFPNISKKYATTTSDEVSIPAFEGSAFLSTEVTASEPASNRSALFGGRIGDAYAAAYATPLTELLALKKAELSVDFRKFYSLLNSWKNEAAFFSSISDQVASPSYLKIIGMGEKVLPLILRELKEDPAMFFPALEAITGLDDVIPEESYGDLEAMSEAWLNWGRAKKLI